MLLLLIWYEDNFENVWTDSLNNSCQGESAIIWWLDVLCICICIFICICICIKWICNLDFDFHQNCLPQWVPSFSKLLYVNPNMFWCGVYLTPFWLGWSGLINRITKCVCITLPSVNCKVPLAKKNQFERWKRGLQQSIAFKARPMMLSNKSAHVLGPPLNSEFSFHINSLNTKIFIKGRFWPRPQQLCTQVQLPVAGLSGLELPARPFPRGGETNPVQGLWHQVRHHRPRESRWEGQFENRNKSILICFNKCHYKIDPTLL